MPTHASPVRRGPRALTDQTPVVLLIAVLAVVGAGAWANAATAGPDRPPVIVSAVVATAVVLLTVALALGRGRAVRRLRSQVTDLENRLAGAQVQVQTQNTRAAQLADQILPAVVKRLRDGASPEVALAEIAEIAEITEMAEIGAAGTTDPRLPRGTDPAEWIDPAGRPAIVQETGVVGDAAASWGVGDEDREARETHRRILRTLATEIGRGERMRAAAMSACANAAGRVQALATSMLADLREMEERHDEEVFGDLLRLDHATAQAGRLADSIAVLTGARTGRRWTKPIVMESILRGAVGRISAYQRVRLHSTSTVAVAGYAAEGVMHALAELMDNATSFSPPSEEVHVYVEEVQAGIVVTIEDGGLVMGPAALRRAEAAVSAEPLDLTTLSGTRLGLAVVGVLARKHGLTVSFRPSSRGGTGVVVMIPRRLITQPRPNPAAARLPADKIAGAAAAAPGAA
ncbi:ATP-binding protein, partial [Frankia sp. AiPs1]|uniref:ATP-binding protein n=1 Tax=Frankia sp. AiPs1 TaxID=573493 RepID=UPI0020447C87